MATSIKTSKDKYTYLFWVLVACTVITVIITVFMMYRMSQKPAVPSQIAKVMPSQMPSQMPPQMQPQPIDPSEFVGANLGEKFAEGTADLIYIYSESCGWCDRFNPVWNDFSERYSGPLRVMKIEAKQPEAKSYNVTGYPTVIIMQNGVQKALFSDDRTVENLTKFAKSNE